jgi:toluene monooxygenase system ferredoxin subunit
VSFVRVASLQELWEGELLGCVVERARVVVVRGPGFVAAYEDRCAHLGVPLSEGTLQGCILTCRAHLWQYDARTGAGVNPRSARLRALPVRVEGGAIYVDPAPEHEP